MTLTWVFWKINYICISIEICRVLSETGHSWNWTHYSGTGYHYCFEFWSIKLILCSPGWALTMTCCPSSLSSVCTAIFVTAGTIDLKLCTYMPLGLITSQTKFQSDLVISWATNLIPALSHFSMATRGHDPKNLQSAIWPRVHIFAISYLYVNWMTCQIPACSHFQYGHQGAWPKKSTQTLWPRVLCLVS
jgi:hypothetical protein